MNRRSENTISGLDYFFFCDFKCMKKIALPVIISDKCMKQMNDVPTMRFFKQAHQVFF